MTKLTVHVPAQLRTIVDAVAEVYELGIQRGRREILDAPGVPIKKVLKWLDTLDKK